MSQARESEFSFPATEVDVAGKSYRFAVRAAWVRGVMEGIEGERPGPGREDGELEVRASLSGRDVVVHGRLSTAITLPCARCLAETEIRIEKPIALLVVADASKASPAFEDGEERTADEPDTVAFDGETVVLDEVVRDELLLEMPMIPLCSETCPGISPGGLAREQAGDEVEAIDPRLAPLLKFSKRIKE